MLVLSFIFPYCEVICFLIYVGSYDKNCFITFDTDGKRSLDKRPVSAPKRRKLDINAVTDVDVKAVTDDVGTDQIEIQRQIRKLVTKMTRQV